MKKGDRNSMMICFTLGLIFLVMAALGVINGEVYNFFEPSRHNSGKLILSGEQPVYFWLIITSLCVLATLFLNSAYLFWQDRHKNNDEDKD
jgi:hypothetical protein